MADHTLRDYFQRRVGALKKERTSFMDHWRDLSDFNQPKRGRFLATDRNRGGKGRWSNIINSKATRALRTCRAGMLAGTMSPARPWFSFQTPDPDLMEFQPVKIWLRKQELLIRAIFNDSNLYTMAPTMIGELILFGTGLMTHVDDFKSVARFYTHTVGSYMLAQNDRFEVDTFAREFQMTTGQMVSKFGRDKVSTGVKTMYDRGDYEDWHDVTHVVEPNPDAEPDRQFSRFQKFRSVYYEPKNADHDAFLSRSGFKTFPAYAPRWDLTGEDIYATDCPGMTALGDVKSLQIEEKRKAQGIDKMVNPPMKGPATLRNVPISGLPGGVTLYDGDKTRELLQPIYLVNPQIRELMEDIDKVETRIDEAFYVDMFMAISSMEGIQPRNELDLSQRDQERLLQLGPVLQRLQGEWQGQMIDRTFTQSVDAGIVSPAPQELQDQELEIRFIGSLAMAQRAVATSGIERVAAFAGGLVNAGWQGVVEKFDAEQAIDEFANAIGTPPRIVIPDEIVEERRAVAKREQEKQQQMEMAAQMTAMTKDLGAAKTDTPSALTAVSGAVEKSLNEGE